ncbi:YchJ family protein [Pontiella sp.]|uniref:YchJ family protein n=1 Tax=Pontiella sp. TaxID=2837462 RepID=UPI00356A2AF3
MNCPCGSGSPFGACCGAFLSGGRTAATAEQLMRSRYCAYVVEDVDYLVRTTHPSSRTPGLAASIRNWMDQVQWLRLHVLAAGENTVEFIAEYISEGKPGRLHERSRFKQKNGEWFYVGEA